MKILRKSKWYLASLAFILGYSEMGLAEKTDSIEGYKPDQGPIYVEKADVKITPVQGWFVFKDFQGMSLFIKEPETKEIVYDKPKYQRNIALLTFNEPSPIDLKRVEQLKEELQTKFSGQQGASGMIQDFKILEAKLFDYRKKEDGILVYTTMKLNGYQMMQMHVMVSGSTKHYLMTYTDLNERFQNNQDYGFAAAWSAMTSIEVEGEGPSRFDTNRKLYAGLSGLGLICLGFGFLGLMRARTNYRDIEEKSLESTDIFDTRECSTF